MTVLARIQRASAGTLTHLAWVPLCQRLVASVLLLALGYALASQPLDRCLALLLAGFGGILLLRRPALGLYPLAFAVPFGSLRELPFGAWTVGLSELLVTAIATAWALRMMAQRRIRIAGSWLGIAIALHLFTVLISWLPARELSPAIKESIKWVEILILYLFVSRELSRGERLTLSGVLLAAGALQGLLGIYQFTRQVGPPEFILFGRFMRAHGTFAQPNPFGGYMGLLLPLAYGLAMSCRRGVRSWLQGDRSRDNLKATLLFGWATLSGLILSLALIMSWSRGALLGLVAGLGLVVLALGRRVWPGIAIAALLLFLLSPDILAALPGGVVQRMADIVEYTGRDLTRIEITDANFAIIERAAHWQAAWRMFSRRPWLGVGSGQYAVVYHEVALPRWQEPLGHAHNTYLNVLAEGGLLGLGTYLLVMGAALAVAWRAARHLRGSERGIALGALGMMGHLLAHSLVDSLFVHEMYLVVAIVLGMAGALLYRDDRFARREADTA